MPHQSRGRIGQRNLSIDRVLSHIDDHGPAEAAALRRLGWRPTLLGPFDPELRLCSVGDEFPYDVDYALRIRERPVLASALLFKRLSWRQR